MTAAALGQRQPDAEQSVLSLVDVLGGIADELERTRGLGLRVEGAICVTAVAAGADVTVIEQLQQFDLILQRVAALRDFALELSRQCDPAFGVDVASALARITLEEMRSRLGGALLTDDMNDDWEML